MAKKNHKENETGDTAKNNNAKITLDGIDKDLSGVIAVIGPDTPAFRILVNTIYSKMLIPEITLDSLLNYRLPKPEGIFFCPVYLTRECMKTATDTMRQLSDRYGGSETLVLFYYPNFYDELYVELSQLKAAGEKHPEKAISEHIQLLQFYLNQVTCMEENMFYMCQKETEANYEFQEPICQIRKFLSRFRARKLIKTEEWKADLLARTDLAKVLPDKDSPRPKASFIANTLYLTDVAPLDRSIQDIYLGTAQKWLEGKIESYADSYGLCADKDLAREICKEIACISTVPVVYARQPDTNFPMVLPNCTFSWDKALQRNETEIMEKLKPFFALAGDDPVNMTKWACTLKSMMEPAGSAGYGVYLACSEDALLLIHAGLDPLFWYRSESLIQPEDPATTVQWYSMTKKELSQPNFMADAEKTMLGIPGACNHITVLSGLNVPSCWPTDRILKLMLSNNVMAGQTKTQKKGYAEYLANQSDTYVTPFIAKWVKELSFDRTTDTYFGIKELLAGKLPDNPLLNPGNIPVTGIADNAADKTE